MTPSGVLLDQMRAGKTRQLEQRLARVGLQLASAADWRTQAEAGGPLALHQSQIEALQMFLDTVLSTLSQQVAQARSAASFGDFLTAAKTAQEVMGRTYRAWQAYHERFNQIKAADPVTSRFLRVGDEVAWSGYRVFTSQLLKMGVESARVKFKQPPLFNLYPDLSPITYTRKARLALPNLPVHLIDFPLGEMSAPWSLLTVHHELAHGLSADLNLRPANLIQAGAGLSLDRLAQWSDWAVEIFCDCLAVLLGGPAFVRELMDVLLGMSPGDPNDPARSPHPPPYLRILLLCAFLEELESKRPQAGFATDAQLSAHYGNLAAQYAGGWRSAYAGVDPAPFAPYLDEAGLVLGLLVDTPLPELNGGTARQLGWFTPAEHKLVTRVAENHLAFGEESGEPIAPRLAVAAARVAFDALAAGQGGASVTELEESALRTVEKNRATEGTRGLHLGEERYLAHLAVEFTTGLAGEEDQT